MFIVKGVRKDKAMEKAVLMATKELTNAKKPFDKADLAKRSEALLQTAANNMRPQSLSAEFDMSQSANEYIAMMKKSGEFLCLSIFRVAWKETNGVKDLTKGGRPKKTIEPFNQSMF